MTALTQDKLRDVMLNYKTQKKKKEKRNKPSLSDKSTEMNLGKYSHHRSVTLQKTRTGA